MRGKSTKKRASEENRSFSSASSGTAMTVGAEQLLRCLNYALQATFSTKAISARHACGPR